MSAAACKRCGLNFTSAEPQDDASQDGGAEQYLPSSDNSYQSYGYYRPSPVAPKSTGLAVASLVLGVISFFTLGLLGVGALAGLVMGIVALRRTRRQPHLYGGEGLAIGGIVLGGMSTLTFGFVMLIAAIALPNLFAARRAANEAGVIAKLRQIAAAESTYLSTVGMNQRYGTLQELVANNLLDPELARGVKYGYRFNIRVNSDSFEAVATPTSYGQTSSPGKRSFYVSSDSGYVIHGADKKGLEANLNDPPLGPEPEPYKRSNRRAYSDSYSVQEY